MSEIGEQWSPITEPERIEESTSALSEGSTLLQTATAIGMRMPKVPHEVPVENAIRAASVRAALDGVGEEVVDAEQAVADCGERPGEGEDDQRRDHHPDARRDAGEELAVGDDAARHVERERGGEPEEGGGREGERGLRVADR